MTSDQLDLARQLAARPEWRWRPGMCDHERPVYGTRVVMEVGADGRIVRWVDDIGDYAEGDGWNAEEIAEEWADAAPLLTDDATAGCLLAMVPGLRTVVRRDDPLGWAVRYADPQDGAECWVSTTLWCPTLGEACARALLAAWGAR
jgi:hypothetical protein